MLKVITQIAVITTAAYNVAVDAFTHPDDFVCLGDQAKKITFANNASKEVPMGPGSFLPQVRIMQGGYLSQWGLTYS